MVLNFFFVVFLFFVSFKLPDLSLHENERLRNWIIFAGFFPIAVLMALSLGESRVSLLIVSVVAALYGLQILFYFNFSFSLKNLILAILFQVFCVFAISIFIDDILYGVLSILYSLYFLSISINYKYRKASFFALLGLILVIASKLLESNGWL